MRAGIPLGKFVEVSVEQQGVQGTGIAPSARTVLPGEPFDPPAASAVPAPRNGPPTAQPPATPFPGQQFPPLLQPSAPAPPQGIQQPLGGPLPAYGQQFPTYGTVDAVAPQASYGVPTAPAQLSGIPDAGAAYEALHEYASLPIADPAQRSGSAPVAPAGFPSAPQPSSYQPYAGSQFPGQPGVAPAGQPSLPPVPPMEFPGEDSTEAGEHRRPGRKPSKAVLAVLVVAVLGGGGYFGYSHFVKKSDSGSDATTPATAPVAPPPVHHYAFPSALGSYQLQSSSAGAALRAPVQKFAKQVYPSYAKTLSFAAYHVGSPQVYAWTLRPGSANVAQAYATLLNRVQAFRLPGTVYLPMATAPSGAAGGQLTCGSQRGNAAASYCVWHNTTTIGYFTVTGSDRASDTAALTRELRAYAEH